MRLLPLQLSPLAEVGPEARETSVKKGVPSLFALIAGLSLAAFVRGNDNTLIGSSTFAVFFYLRGIIEFKLRHIGQVFAFGRE